VPILLRAEPGDYAPIVLLPDDPGHATLVAGMLDGGLRNATLVTDHRAMYGYTGRYRGVPISVQSTGMGAPSLSMVVEELLGLGARRLIRVGRCLAIGRGIGRGDLVIASAATPADGATRTYLHEDPGAPTADFGLIRALADRAAEHATTCHVGQVCTVDVFYDRDPEAVSTWRSRGVLALEMETSPLYYLASRASAAGDDVRAVSMLTVSDVLFDETTSAESSPAFDALDAAMRTMIEVALEAAVMSR
jgi:purine-nucleoside phosphorylase